MTFSEVDASLSADKENQVGLPSLANDLNGSFQHSIVNCNQGDVRQKIDNSKTSVNNHYHNHTIQRVNQTVVKTQAARTSKPMIKQAPQKGKSFSASKYRYCNKSNPGNAKPSTAATQRAGCFSKAPSSAYRSKAAPHKRAASYGNRGASKFYRGSKAGKSKASSRKTTFRKRR